MQIILLFIKNICECSAFEHKRLSACCDACLRARRKVRFWWALASRLGSLHCGFSTRSRILLSVTKAEVLNHLEKINGIGSLQ